ncbi:MAG: hypothetical protein AAGE61_16855 [Pseudomonadota bacterium]
MTKTDITHILSAWNEPDPDKRRAIVVAATTQNFVYDDVHKKAPITGQDAFLGFLDFFRSRVAGVTMAADSAPDVLEGAARMRFKLTRDGEIFSRGTYFVTLAEDGRIASLFGFMDQEPA